MNITFISDIEVRKLLYFDNLLLATGNNGIKENKRMKKQMRFQGKIISVRKGEQMSELEKGGDAGQMLTKQDILNFYWEKDNQMIWLFSQKYSQSVHEKFRRGLRDYDIRNYDKWKRNPRMDKTIDKIPVYVAYAEREIS